MKSPDVPPAGIRPWVSAVALAVGLGAAPLILALDPWPAWAVLAAVLAIVLVAAPSAAAEQASAKLDADEARQPLRPGAAFTAQAAALVATCLAGLAVVQATWAATAIAQLALGGTASTTPEGVESWMGARQGFLGVAGWQGSGALLAACVLVVALGGVLLGGRSTSRWLVALLACWLAATLACGLRLWTTRTTPVAGLWDGRTWLPSGDRASLQWGLAALLVALLACGPVIGAVQAATLRLGPQAAGRRRGRLLLPLAATALGVAALAPLGSAPIATPLLAPAPYGRQAALLLVAPPALLVGAGWQLAWFAGLLAASVLGVLVASQPALRFLREGLGLGARGAAATLAALLGLIAVPCLLLPGCRESLLVAGGLGLVVMPLRILVADWPRRWRDRVLRSLAMAPILAAIGIVSFAAELTWPDDALLLNGLLGLSLVLLLLLFWTPLAVLAVLRARRLRRPAPASPAGPRTRA